MILPIAPVIAPIIAIVTKIPRAKTAEISMPREVFFSPLAVRNPMMSGILERWQGLRRMLKIPQANDAAKAMAMPPDRASLKTVKSQSTYSPFATCFG